MTWREELQAGIDETVQYFVKNYDLDRSSFRKPNPKPTIFMTFFTDFFGSKTTIDEHYDYHRNELGFPEYSLINS